MLASTLIVTLGLTFPQQVPLESPVRLETGDGHVKVEPPGYACPCWADADGDGKKDLVVGQFAGGRMKVYRNVGNGKLDEGKWLEAGGQPATLQDVW
jgi:hypothetical protein